MHGSHALILPLKTGAGARRPTHCARSMLELPCVTLACIDCAHHELAIAAIEQSLVHCRFGRVLFFTDCDLRMDELEVVRIPALRTPHEHARFTLTELSGHITTSNVLFIGWDAFVVNPAAWDVSFLAYDFVAPPYGPGPPRLPRYCARARPTGGRSG